jgi:type I restriction enzyme M protein
MKNNQKVQASNGTLELRRDDKGKIWSHIRQKWLVETPEERVRQEYVCALANEYEYSIEQMEEEMTPPGARGTANARADIVLWHTVADRKSGDNPLIVVECKADNVTIDQGTYTQGGNYANYCKARFFVTHNHRQTKYWKVDHSKLAPNYAEIKDIPHAGASEKEINEILASLRTFREDEFADLLHQCHNVIRNREHLDPAAAFDEIAKILFVKVWSERRMRERGERKNLFTVDVLNQQLSKDPINSLFDQTKDSYRTDKIFDPNERINLRPATVEDIVKRLQAYNLSDTSEDVKGIAFERFLGRTFRGEIGQFFTPRSIVEFMIRMVEPKEKELICDPASGSGGFLIRSFELVREQIAADVDRQYKEFASSQEKQKLSEAKKAEQLTEKWDELQAQLDPVSDPDRPAKDKQASRIYHLANHCIYGTDANDRMARTSKMNMIMHGDGHGGVHHHNGFLNVNGIFEGRFDIILTNPPFGSNVEPSDKILAEQLKVSQEARTRYEGEYGDRYRLAVERVQSAIGSSIGTLFRLPVKNAKGEVTGKIKTEILFIERCLDLLKPGGRLGIVLPEGIFNNPSLAYVREFSEDRAYIQAIVSLPQETFSSSGASVKASLLFMRKFTEQEQTRFDDTKQQSLLETRAKYAAEIEAETVRLEGVIEEAKKQRDADGRKAAQKELADFLKRMEERIKIEARWLLKKRFSYPIFLYEAEKVGISATGEEDANELYPGKNFPAGLEKSCLELYREFQKNPDAFLLAEVGA